MKKKVRAVSGGTSASKTFSIMMILTAKAQKDFYCSECNKVGQCSDTIAHGAYIEKRPKLTSVVAESVPHLKRGAMRDFQNFMKKHRYWNDARWNKTSRTYTFETGSQIEFFSAGDGDELKGGRRDRLFLNECNNLTWKAYTQLQVRTREETYLDWNPDASFWFYENLQGEDHVEHLTLTYKDNEGLTQEDVDNIESRKGNERWWKVYGLGQLGEAEGRVFTGWKLIDEIPHEARLLRRGLDFGYTNDPSSCIDIWEYNGGYILDELFYQKGMRNRHIAEKLKEPDAAYGDINPGEILVKADSAEPKSIDDIREHGVNISGAEKGKGSINQGIDWLQDQKISVTKRSTNLIKEYRGYMWAVDKRTEAPLNVPEGDDHALDAVRYGLNSEIKNGLYSKAADDILESVYNQTEDEYENNL